MWQNRTREAGFTLIELMISVTVAILVLTAATSLGITTWRTFGANEIRENVHRGARFVALSLERDFQGTGVGMASTPSFGTLAVWGDTIIILRVPYEPNEAPAYVIDPPAGTANPLPVGGTCGPRCIDFKKQSGAFDLKAGDLARLQVNDTRHLILLESVTQSSNSAAVQFSAHSSLLRYPAGLANGLRLDRFGTFTQEVAPVVYYRDADRLMRAQSFKADGTLDGEVVAYGVHAFDVTLLFLDGDSEPEVNVNDADFTNDFDDVVGVRIDATIGTDTPDPRINGGSIVSKNYTWHFAPRNLMWERNRI